MDPTETLRLAREATWNKDWEEAGLLFAQLDLWVSNGGFLPTPWIRAYL